MGTRTRTPHVHTCTHAQHQRLMLPHEGVKLRLGPFLKTTIKSVPAAAAATAVQKGLVDKDAELRRAPGRRPLRVPHAVLRRGLRNRTVGIRDARRASVSTRATTRQRLDSIARTNRRRRGPVRRAESPVRGHQARRRKIGFYFRRPPAQDFRPVSPRRCHTHGPPNFMWKRSFKLTHHLPYYDHVLLASCAPKGRQGEGTVLKF